MGLDQIQEGVVEVPEKSLEKNPHIPISQIILDCFGDTLIHGDCQKCFMNE